MSSANNDAEAAAERLEAALEHIARLAVRPNGHGLSPEATEQLAHRLEAMIERLRAALNSPT
jgi:hypothetical protein